MTFAILSCVTTTGWTEEPKADPRIDFNIPQQRADLALTEFAEQADLTLAVPRDMLRGKEANALVGSYTLQDGVDVLLAGTGLIPEFSNQIVLSIKTDPESVGEGKTMKSTRKKAGLAAMLASLFAGGASAQEPRATDDDGEEFPEELEEIIVTGTNIRGVDPTSPSVTLDRQFFRDTGVTETAELLRDLPQNFAALTPQSNNVISAADANLNTNLSSSINLRGLGADATLVLIDGMRLTQTSRAATADISAIPLSAIERVDVVMDGASAIYGADAVGGVVNFVLRDDFEGLELNAEYRTPTQSGGGEAFVASGLFGHSWGGGNGFVSYEYRDQNPLLASDRSFASASPDFFSPETFALVPESTSHNVLAKISSDFSERARFEGHFLYANRDTLSRRGDNPAEGVEELEVDAGQIQISGQFSYELVDDIFIDLLGSYDRNQADQRFGNINVDGSPLAEGSLSETDDEAWSIDARLSGDLIDLPAGAIGFAIGAQFRSVEGSLTPVVGGFNTAYDQERDISSSYAELAIPLVAEELNIPLVYELIVSLAGRYDDISDAGSEFSPKIGVLYQPISDVALRFTYSESFKAPRFSQQQGLSIGNLLTLSDPVSSSGRTPTILRIGSSAQGELNPEQAQTITAGFDYNPAWLSGFNISASYFDIEFENRVATPNIGPSPLLFLVNEDQFLNLITRNPTTAELQDIIDNSTVFNNSALFGDPFVEPIDALAIADIRSTNLAGTNLSGIDVSLGYQQETAVGRIRYSGNFNYLFDFEVQNDPSSSVLDVVDTLFNPAAFRFQTGLSWDRQAYSASAFVNFVGGYDNETVTPAEEIDSWTTVDLNLSANLGEMASETHLLSDTRISLNISNLFDQDPPGVESGALITPVGFDPINADPFGRVIRLQVSKAW